MLKKIVFLTLLSMIFSCSKKQEVKPLIYREIPVEDFCKPLTEMNFKMSPNGDFVAYVKYFNSKLNLFSIKTSNNTFQQITYNRQASISNFVWVNNNLMAFTLDYDGNGYNELYVIQPNRGGFKQLSGTEKADYRLTDLKTGKDNELFVEISDEQFQIYTLVRLNLANNKRQIVMNNPGNLLGYLADNQGQVRLATFYTENGSGILYRDSEKEPFKEVLRNTFQEVISPLFFTPDGKSLIVTSNRGRDKAAIHELNLQASNLDKLLFEDQDMDVYEAFKSDKRGVVTGAALEKDSLELHFFDQTSAELQQELNQLFPKKTVKITQTSDDEQKFVISVSNGSHPGEIYFYNRADKKLNLLMNLAFWLKESDLAKVKSVVINSNDNFKLFTYLTQPKNPNGTAVILVHGGPWDRDYRRYNADAQFLANRGYLVAQVNYRGSLGYGRKFLESSYKEWGKNIINDLARAANWLKETQNVSKIGIMGTSFGGYAALRSLQLYPDLYQCAVTQSALIDILSLRRNSFAGENDPNNQLIGHPVKDYQLLRDFSPFYNYSAIKSPILLTYGDQDPTVNLKQVDSLVANLQKQGVTAEYSLKKFDGHVFEDYQNKIDYYKSVEIFLKKYLLGLK